MNIRKRVAVFLCLLLTIPTILGALPQAKLEAQAATSTYVGWWYLSSGSTGEPEVQVTKSTKGLYIGDYMYASSSNGDEYKYYGMLSTNSGVKYKSSNTSVAAINSTTGLVTPKKTGSTKITITFKGVSKTCTIKVVSSLGKVSANYDALKKASNALIKGYGKKITTSSRYKVVNLRNQYLEERDEAEYSSVNRYSGIEQVSQQSGNTWSYVNKAHMPMLAHANAISNAVEEYVKELNPIGTGSAKLFKVTSATGKGSTVTAKVSRKVNADQIFALKASVSRTWDTYVASGNTAKFPVYVKDMSTGHRYYAIATAIKGKNTLSIKLQSSTLKKGRTYKLVGVSGYEIYRDWTNQGKVTFKAK